VFLALSKGDTSASAMLQHMQQYTTTFNQINNNLAEGLDTADESQQLPTVIKRIGRIKQLANTRKSSTLRYLFVLRDNLDHLQDMMDGWQSDLDEVNGRLIQNQHDILKFKNDSLLANAMPTDTALREAFFDKRAELGQLWKKTDSANRHNLLKVNLLQSKISTAYSMMLDESDQIDTKIKHFAIRAMNGEFDYIWVRDHQFTHIDSALQGTINLNRIQVNYFFKNETTVHIIAIAFLLLVVAWILYNKYKTVKHFEHKEIVIDHARFVYKKPVVSALLMATTIIPYFYDHPPVFVAECFFLITTILVLIMVKDHFPLSLFHFLHQLFWLTVIYSLSNLLIQIADVDRYVIFLLSIACIVFALIFYKRIQKEPQGHLKYTKLTLWIFIIMQFISLVLNVTGRFSLAKIVGITAVFNLWLTMSLYFIIRIIIQVLYLQLHTKRAERSFISLVDYNTLQNRFRSILSVFATLLWLFFLLQNLNIDDWVHDWLSDALTQQRTMGGASFTLGGFVIFFVVIWVSSMLSRLISYFYDISAQHSNDLAALKKKNRASTLLIRIGVFTVGFLLAVAASGFPLDKLTIIFSAFGVGIGFGLQNVTNNLVSGMILAFEKPIQIGDIIEVNNRTGTVKEIGIRSSKLATGEGSEIIIPNGDLISQNVVNWTLSNTNRQVDILVSVALGTEISKVTQILKDLLTNRDDIMSHPEPQVFLNGITDKSIDFKVLFWAADLSDYLELRSRILSGIYENFTKEGIRMPKS
jgi:small-conductance mechanosensitive channel